MAAKPPEIRAARAFLRSRRVSSKEINPRKFANASKELGQGFRETMNLLRRLRGGGQGQATQRRIDVSKAAESGE